MKGYGMGQQDWKDDRARRLAARYPDREQPGAVTHVVVDGEDFAVGVETIESVEVLPSEEKPKKKAGRPAGSKNKAKD